ncbi:Protein lin-10 [Frankliniella fusca]|uniref:Protein lin-10 n=1 Tax=Frankliniella fusca TaxID=407009 RepID=A0AAE1LKW1_9NEOP|nr:Protein lin-10 [Frankliniella fusca]
MTSVAGLQLDSLASSERITELFPKCRPRDARDSLSLSLNVAASRLNEHNKSSLMDSKKGQGPGLGLGLGQGQGQTRDQDGERLDCDEEADDASASAVDSSDDESNDSDGPGPSPGPGPAASLSQAQAQAQVQGQAQSPLGHATGQASHENHGEGSSGAYKLRDSRIIEIAGGREVFCQSRSKPGRKGRHVREPRERDEANVSKTNKTESSERRVWELRSRCGEAKRQRNSRDVTDIFTSDSRGRHRGISGNAAYEPVPTTAPSLNMGGGEVVVFDDIGENWRGNDSSSAASTPSPPGHHRAPSHYFKVSTSVSDAENDSLSPDREDGPDETDDIRSSRNALPSSLSGSHLGGNRSTASRKGSRVIGGLPIADYEGSPKRYGPRQGESGGSHGPSHPTLPSAHSLLSSPSLLTPRPGFPQRVLPDCNLSPPTSTASTTNSTFDYLYEFSETRKVLEEFFKPSSDLPSNEDNSHFQELEYELRRQSGQNASSCNSGSGSAYVGLRLAKAVPEHSGTESPHNDVPSTTNDLISLQEQPENEQENNLMELSTGSGSTEDLGDTEVGLQVGHSRNFTLSPETTDCDSNCGDLDSEVSLLLTDGDTPGLATGLTGGLGSGLSSGLADIGSGLPVDAMRLYSSMPVLEDGLSSGHASDTDNNNPTVMLMKRQITEIERELGQRSGRSKLDDRTEHSEPLDHLTGHMNSSSANNTITNSGSSRDRDSSYPDPELEALDPLAQWCAAGSSQNTPPPPAPAPHRNQTGSTPDSVSQNLPCRSSVSSVNSGEGVEDVIKDIRLAIQRAKTLPVKSVESEPPQPTASPIWVPRRRNCDNNLRSSTLSGDEHADDDEADTDLETDRLLGQLRTDDIGFYEPQTVSKNLLHPEVPQELYNPAVLFLPNVFSSTPILFIHYFFCAPIALQKGWRKSTKSRTVMPSSQSSSSLSKNGGCSATTPLLSQSKLSSPPHPSLSVAALLSPTVDLSTQPCVPTSNSISSNANSNDIATSSNELTSPDKTPSPRSAAEANAVGKNKKDKETGKKKGRNKEDGRWNPSVLIEGVLFRARYLGSTQLVCEGQPTKTTRMMQAEEAVSRIKAPDGETQPSTEVDLFISTEKIMVLNTDLKEIMMDHALRTISYIADIGDLVVLMARRRFMPQDDDSDSKLSRTPKMICHVFQSEEAQFIAQSIGQAFQVAYMEFLKANGIEDNSFVKEMDYQEVLNSQEIFGDELQMFAKKEMQKEVVVPKAKGEILGVVIVESGWGSMLPTVVIANLAPAGAAARCGQLNIGDQIIAINGVSLVGLPLSTCQNYIKNTKTQTVVKLTVVPCAPVVEVKIKRPETKYQLGFSVQNGVICSLLRGGIAERGGVRVGHRIIEINNQSVVAVPHEKIVNLLATSVGEILMKTMPTSMFRLLTGQETPIYI